ncbi:superoxide dismutase [Mn], mitochondrial-like [Juglans microcarpa x Juglans regia]|uniref:superoxide dismutase [Mn], mitochondrial-like n=1 Tax=Juglans microcarpa x Juglans regia TaxID=2249226 RepID=UPI001B7F5F13|nr:superoxide dismutase [Mn], mitochondrial-like [Juglans microcarpa x Juglans regia]
MDDSSTIVWLQSAIKFNSGGHINHSIIWKNLSQVKAKLGGEPPKPSLCSAIDTLYGSLDVLIQKVNVEGTALQGSGQWLALDKEWKQLSVETTTDQDPLVTRRSALVSLIRIDVWEHIYYLQYRDVKSNYLKNIWKVINWKYASKIYEKEYPRDNNKLLVLWLGFLLNVGSGLFDLDLSVGLFASIIALFGGFFASGFKRAFKIKILMNLTLKQQQALYIKLGEILHEILVGKS